MVINVFNLDPSLGFSSGISATGVGAWVEAIFSRLVWSSQEIGRKRNSADEGELAMSARKPDCLKSRELISMISDQVGVEKDQGAVPKLVEGSRPSISSPDELLQT